MNRGLLAFSILVIVLGLFLGTYFVPLIGIFLLFIALLAPSGPRQSIPPAQSPPVQTVERDEQPDRPYVQSSMMSAPSPHVVTRPQTTPSPQPAPAQAPSGYELRSAAGSPALFPTTMFPSFAQAQPPVGQTVEEKGEERKKESRDELLELLAILAVLRIASA